ncbi:hypothetical protein KA082_01270 [Candidatus Woesebacteria bacterium]|nr:hypothetical protein [Candidatus Woesebacteria bacterium]
MSSDQKSPDESFSQAMSILEAQQSPLKMNPVGQANAIANLVMELQQVELHSPLAQQNATSISDNNGGRIELVDDDTPMKK